MPAMPPATPFAQMSLRDKFTYFLGIGLGSGLSPKAPGTMGSLAVLIFIPLWLAVGHTASLIIIAVATLIGIPICGRSATLLGVHDDKSIVWDEFAGQSITLIPLILLDRFSWLNVLIAFGLFRLFDIWKPWPIRYLDEEVHGGLGIMLDDILAGLIAMVLLWAGLVVLH